MKKMLAVAAILMLVPFTAFGMEMMADTALEDVTGQAGVSISVDNIQMDFSLGYLAWGDEDGFGADFAAVSGITQAAGYVNMSHIRMTGIVIDKYLIGTSGITPINTSLTPDQLQFLTIDVGSYPSALQANGTFLDEDLDTAVRIGVPSLTIYVAAIDTIEVALTSAVTDSPAIGDTLGSISMGAMQLDTKSGALYILAH